VNAAEVVRTLLSIGVTTKEAYSKYRSTGSAEGWKNFLNSTEYGNIASELRLLVSMLDSDSVQQAVVCVQSKKAAFRAGRSLAALGAHELEQYDALLDAESVLVMKQLHTVDASSVDFLGTLVDDVLPVLTKVAKLVIPLLV
jgi:hypothetical protein